MSTSAQSALTADRPEHFQLKGGLFPLTLLELKTADLTDIETELTQKVQRSPAFFRYSPLVFGFDQLSSAQAGEIDLHELLNLCRHLELIPVAIRGGDDELSARARTLGLASLPKSRDKTVIAEKSSDLQSTRTSSESGTDKALDTDNHSKEQQGVASETEAVNPPASRVISVPVRSGQQIYAPGGDLIILSSVSPGAEVLADGNIHIYGALRGRALAGIQGDQQARIFCTSQEAELVSIAGEFMVDEALRAMHWKQAVQISLEEGNMTIRLQT